MSPVEKQITIQDFCKKGLASPRSKEHEHHWYKVAVGHWKVALKLFSLMLACIDKWVNSKFEDATPPALCSGPKLAIWNKNQPPRPEKTPGHGEKSKMAILVLFGSRRSLGEKETDLYNDSCPTVFNLYDIHTPQTPARHTQTPS